jgi:hypothetical protein
MFSCLAAPAVHVHHKLHLWRGLYLFVVGDHVHSEAVDHQYFWRQIIFDDKLREIVDGPVDVFCVERADIFARGVTEVFIANSGSRPTSTLSIDKYFSNFGSSVCTSLRAHLQVKKGDAVYFFRQLERVIYLIVRHHGAILAVFAAAPCATIAM